MIVDATRDPPPGRIACDLAIVGSGAAGITLALALADAGLDIVMIEAGGDRFDAAAQDYYRAQSVTPDAHGPAHMYRRRQLGGSTAVWGGRCIPFDPIDFETRPWMAAARWPIGHDAIARHYPRALEIAQAGLAEFDAALADPAHSPSLIPGADTPDLILERIERFSHPLDFGKYYRDRLAAMPGFRLFTGLAAQEILTDGTGDRATGVRARTVGGAETEIAARRVVLAAGGIETARLLLASDRVRPQGLGNERDLVGRFYQCHLEGELGEIVFHDPARAQFDYFRSHDGVYCRRFLWLSPEAQRREHLAGLVMRPAHPSIVDPHHRHPILSAMFLVKDGIVPEYARKMTALEHEARRAFGGSRAAFYAAHVRNVILGSPRLATFGLDWARRRILAKRKLPSVVLTERSGRYPLDLNGEQEPNRDSRVRLGDERDGAGLRRIVLDWRVTDADLDRMVRGVRVIRRALDETKIASLHLSEAQVEEWTANPVPVGGHHIGTARMADDPADGVCDSQCELFGTRGLFIAGAAALPTSSFANPTLTLMALTLRLAEHLRARPA